MKNVYVFVAGKSKPIHCVIEHASPPSRPVTPPSAKSNVPCETNVELDTYAILPSNTLFSEIVRVALVKLGYTAAEAIGAKGRFTLITELLYQNNVISFSYEHVRKIKTY